MKAGNIDNRTIVYDVVAYANREIDDDFTIIGTFPDQSAAKLGLIRIRGRITPGTRLSVLPRFAD
jgi:hypothetical protein